jgi:hypothetical protein
MKEESHAVSQLLMQTMIRSLAINFINLNKFSNIKQARKIFAWNTGKL